MEYRINLEYQADFAVYVDAENEEEAKKIALNKADSLISDHLICSNISVEKLEAEHENI